MTAETKRLTLLTWTAALEIFKRRLRKCLRIVLASGIPLELVRMAVDAILDDAQAQEK